MHTENLYYKINNRQPQYSYDEAFQESLKYFNNDDFAASTFTGKYALQDPELNDKQFVENNPQMMHERIASELSRIDCYYKFGKDNVNLKLFVDDVNEISEYCNDRINFYLSYLKDFKKIVMQGSPSYGIGNKYVDVSLSNCVVIEAPEDSTSGITKAVNDAMHLWKARCGVGIDISSLRPEGVSTSNSSKTSTGAWSWANFISEGCRMIGQSGRRGATMITLDVKHPDADRFTTMKSDLTYCTGANISLKITDEFMNAATNDTIWTMTFPLDLDYVQFIKDNPGKWVEVDAIVEGGVTKQLKSRLWKPNNPHGVRSMIREVSAKELWMLINDRARASAEPGLLFWDNYNANLPACEYPEFLSTSTNPCSEISLSPYDSCRLATLNVTGFIKNPFTENVLFDYESWIDSTMVGMRVMDNLIDLEIECIEKIIDKSDDIHQKELWNKLLVAAKNGRRTGLGNHGWGDTLAQLRIKYDSEEAMAIGQKIDEIFRNSAYQASCDLAKERGAFPVFDWNVEKNNIFIKRLPKNIQDQIKKNGRRNISLLTNAPTGTVSIVCQTSSGIEPVFANYYIRRKKNNPNDEQARVDFVDQSGDKWQEFPIFHHNILKYFEVYPEAKKQWEEIESNYPPKEWSNKISEILPDYFVEAGNIDPKLRVKFQGVLQQYIDHGISSCLAEGTASVQTDKGLYEIEELSGHASVGQFSDLNLNLSSINFKNNLASIGQGYNNGIADVIKITLMNGHSIVCTKNHRLLVLDSNYSQEWKYAGEIKVDDLVIGRLGLNLFDSQASQKSLNQIMNTEFDYSQEINLPTHMSPELARLLGYMCADTSSRYNRNSIFVANSRILEDFSNLANMILGIGTALTEDKSFGNLYNAISNTTELSSFFNWLGLKDHNKIEVPRAIRLGNKSIVKSFLKGAVMHCKISSERICVVKSVSHKYLRQIQAMLVNLGIESLLKCSEENDFILPGHSVNPPNQVWSLTLSQNMACKFATEIGFVDDRKNDEIISNFKRSTLKQIDGFIPDFGLRLKFKNEILPKIKSNRLYDIMSSAVTSDNQDHFLSREFLKEMADFGLNIEDFLLDETYVFRPVVSVEDAGTAPTYDISVPDGESYIVNGVVSHNTINLPKGTKTETIAEIYEEAWKEGLKGVTVYVDGSRSGVLISAGSETGAAKTSIIPTEAPRRPKEMPCDIHRASIEGKYWTIFVGLLNGQPYEIFGGSADKIEIPRRKDKGRIAKRKVDKEQYNGRETVYDLYIGDDDDRLGVKDIVQSFDNGDYDEFTRVLSSGLRHGIPINVLVTQLRKSNHSSITNFSKAIARVLAKYIKDSNEDDQSGGENINGIFCKNGSCE